LDLRAEALGTFWNTAFLPVGVDLVTTTWGILSGGVAPIGDVLLSDDDGKHEGYSCAEVIAERGAWLELFTSDHV
jgi:hypothetical protein